jgi:Ca-activated chloride channel family protein
VNTLTDLFVLIRQTAAEGLQIRWSQLAFDAKGAALLVLAVLAAVTLLRRIVLALRGSRAGRTHIAVPAILPALGRSRAAWVRHTPFVLFVLGIPLFVVAFADPLTAFSREDISYPGRRIAIMVDASASMTRPFDSGRLVKQRGPVFFTTMAAAEYFVKLRMAGPYRDLISLIEFGDKAYVVTPFTTDYENVLLSLRLLNDWNEWQRFGDQGTILIRAINEGTQLFKTFDFLKASGNLMVLFTDGQDTQAVLDGRPLDDIMAEARQYGIPVYMIRLGLNRGFGDVVPDYLWKWAVERTGGQFFPAANEDTILQAVQEIDRLSAGSIEVRRYSVGRPRFSPYALAAVALWLLAATLKVSAPVFRMFP